MGNPEQKSVVTNGGEGTYSYSRNSRYQMLATKSVQSKIEDAIIDKFDNAGACCYPNNNTIRMADMGCATGPNTFLTMQNLVNIILRKLSQLYPSKPPPQFHVFFNDHIANDFNTLFTSLPQDRTYFAAATPGSFHTRLFPDSSLHLVYSSIALHWLSKVPDQVRDPNSVAWNKGRVHYTGASDAVMEAYAAQFGDDMGRFLKARAEELVSGGMVVIIMPGTPDKMPHRRLPAGLMYDLMASSFMDMVKEGMVTEHEVDKFNLPLYSPSPEEVAELVAKNGCFTVEAMELTNPSPWIKGPINVGEWMKHVRAAMEGMLLPHFDPPLIHQLFIRLIHKLSESAVELESCCRDNQLFALLIRN